MRNLIIILASLILVGCANKQTTESFKHKYSHDVLLRSANEAAWIATHLILGAAVLTEKETVTGYGETPYEASENGLKKCRDRINELKENLICKPSQSVPTKWYATELAEIKNQKGPGYENFIKERDDNIKQMVEDDKSRRLKLEEEQRISKLKYEKEQQQSRLKYLENTFGSKCLRYKNNNVEFNKCLNDQELIAKKEKATQEAKQVEEKNKKQLIVDKQKVEEEKANRLLAIMKPEERRAYICEKTYGLRKGSDKFSECVYKILAADVELEKLELQKKLAEAQLETAKANEAAARANAAASASTRNVPAYDPAIGRAAERANEIETARLAFELARQLNPQRYAPQQQNSIQFPKQQYCKLNPINNRISCYTSP